MSPSLPGDVAISGVSTTFASIASTAFDCAFSRCITEIRDALVNAGFDDGDPDTVLDGTPAFGPESVAALSTFAGDNFLEGWAGGDAEALYTRLKDAEQAVIDAAIGALDTSATTTPIASFDLDGSAPAIVWDSDPTTHAIETARAKFEARIKTAKDVIVSALAGLGFAAPLASDTAFSTDCRAVLTQLTLAGGDLATDVPLVAYTTWAAKTKASIEALYPTTPERPIETDLTV